MAKANVCRDKSGYTLTELIIVISIIAVLLSISVPIFNRHLENARKATDTSNAANIRSSLINYINDGTIVFNQGNESVYILVYVDKKQLTIALCSGPNFTMSSNFKGILVNGRTANSAKIKTLLVESGFSDITCKQKGISWYAVAVSGDGSSMYWEGKGRKNLQNGTQIGWN